MKFRSSALIASRTRPNMSDRRRDVRRAPSRSRGRFSTSAHVSNLNKDNRELTNENRQLRGDKKELESSNRRLQGSNRRMVRELDELSAELLASKQAQQTADDKIDDLAATERKLTRQNALLQEEVEREKQTNSELRRSKKSALEAVVNTVSCHMDPEERSGEGGSARSDWKRGASVERSKSEAKRNRRSPGEAADDDSSSTSGAEDAARCGALRKGSPDTGAPASNGGNEPGGPPVPTQPLLGVELPAPARETPPGVPTEEGHSAGGPLVPSPLSPTIRSAAPGAL
ncbi:MAG: hypothetical protein QF749_09180 [Verrucomicrobiota bacterium]|nr:hypothetical protein [Verrucomicrobiota bacterium]MDP7293204.1 hypothetical protein [Verrucomicrobiota bacterium]